MIKLVLAGLLALGGVVSIGIACKPAQFDSLTSRTKHAVLRSLTASKYVAVRNFSVDIDGNILSENLSNDFFSQRLLMAVKQVRKRALSNRYAALFNVPNQRRQLRFVRVFSDEALNQRLHIFWREFDRNSLFEGL